MSEPHNHNKDYLLGCLAYLTTHYGKTKSEESIIAGLPYTDKGMGVQLFHDAAIQAGLKSKTIKRSITEIPSEVLPSVLILKDNRAVVLLSIKGDKIQIYDPKNNRKKTVLLKTIEDDYTGHAIFVHPLQNNRKAARHWFWGVIRDNRPIYRKVLMAAFFINIFGLVGPLFIMNVYDRVIPNNAIETGWVLGIAALVIFGFDFIMRTLRGYFIDIAGRRVDVIVARKIYDQLLNMKLAARPQSSGAFASMIREFESVRDFCTSATVTGLIDLPFSLLFIFVIYLLSGPIAFILLGIMVLVIVIGGLLQIPLKSLIRESMKTAEAKHGLLVETINGLETIKAMRADGQMRAKYGSYVGASAEVGQHSRFFSGMAANVATFFQQSTSIILVLFGMYMVMDGELSMGALIATVIMGGRAITPVGQLTSLVTRFHTVRGSMKTLNSIMAADVERPDGKIFLNRADLSGDIQFDRVSFAYPNTDRKILDGVSFNIKAGETVGVIGRIGSGKSTITKMIAGLYEPMDGDIFADGTDYRQIDPADLRRQIGYISQDTVLFSGSVRDNIIVSYPQATDEEVLEAAKAAGVHDFIARHPMGYDAPVGERGDGLSGGQKQCIALARALITKPRILLLDEPTNDMDIQSEDNFIKQIKTHSKDKTVILVTHRQSLIPLVDRLILIDNGKVIADGPRDEVVKALGGGGSS
ncbi:MAG: type I secretion system permease/ATPase [Alphaproteobacteria bacterium]|nr:MAG: type I secretion system permease/ATPase [Alphaproteobacteria bacterium]